MRRPVQFFNRYTGQLEEESICGEWFFRLAHGTLPGRIFQFLLGNRPLLSRLAAVYANHRQSAKKILPFIRSHGIAADESLVPIGEFTSFNEFFSRRLRPGARPIDGDRRSVVAPADGRHFFIPNLSLQNTLPVKGRRLHLEQFLRDRELAEKFCGGSALISRLCPTDYHRFHFPCDAIPGKAVPISGALRSVHPLALGHGTFFPANQRQLTRLDTGAGEIAMVEVGATFVGTIVQTFSHGHSVEKGEEKGFFAFGGSTVILFFEPKTVEPSSDLLHNSAVGWETYVRCGDRVATKSLG